MSYWITDHYWDFIKKTVKFSHILPRMPSMRKKQRQIMDAEKRDSNEAAQIFLDTLKESEEKGKYQV